MSAATAATPGRPTRRTRAETLRTLLNRTLIVSALGYFVETFDLLLFTVIRVPSLEGIGVPAAELANVTVLLVTAQTLGLVVGGVGSGIVSDRIGRVRVLFGSIALYSLATLANAFVPDVTSYAVLRFIAGVGLAAELGTAVTLVSETLPKDVRSYGTTLVGVIGLHGAIAAAIVSDVLHWQAAFLIGGTMGLGLLLMRWRLAESGMFDSMKARTHRRGDLRLLVTDRRRAARFAASIVMGAPTWFVVAIVVTFSPDLIAPALGVTGHVTAGQATIALEIGLILGNAGCALLCQRLATRWWTILGFLAAIPFLTMALMATRGLSPLLYLTGVGLLGITAGYRIMYLTVVGENFGTNLRNTAVASATNFSRFSAAPITAGFVLLVGILSVPAAVVAIGAITIVLSMVAFLGLDETHDRDLDFIEEDAARAKAPTPGAPAAGRLARMRAGLAPRRG